jgi:uncharacterized lipoprotein YddW (UPF0748 family)
LFFTAAAGAEPELRGIWMHATQIKTRAACDQCVAQIEAAHLNSVFVLVWYWGGQAYYHSRLCPLGEGVEAGYDPLAYLIAECHRRKIEVHAWYVSGNYGAPRVRHVLDQHPEWAVQSDDGADLWYDLGKPQVRKFQSDLMIEALQHYDLDGVHFDYIRYNGPAVCYCQHCQEEFAQRYGFAPLRAEQRDTFPQALSIGANAVGGPTTARVLAQFSDGTPAIATNELGAGKVLLMNWHATRSMVPAVRHTLQRALTLWNAPRDKTFIADTAPNRARYGRNEMNNAIEAFQKQGYRATIVTEDRIAQLPRGSLLVLSGVYLIPDAVAQSLEQFVRDGGLLVVIDGPILAIRNPAVQRVLGMSRAVGFFNRFEVIEPVGKSELVAASTRTIDLGAEKARMAKWAEYRKSGVTELVRDVYRRAKAAKPAAQVTAAVFTPLASAERVFQDWPGWIREGIIDFVIPMAYTMKNEDLGRQIQEWKTVDPRLERVVPGLSVYQRTDQGTASRAPELVLSQHRLCLDQGARGNVYFSLGNFDRAISDALVVKYYRSKTPAYHPPQRNPGKP